MVENSSRILRLGKISYLNVFPIYYPLESGHITHSFQIISGPPTQLNSLMALGKLDISPVSSIEIVYGNYQILPGLGISSCGPVLSVLLLSHYPIRQLDNLEILASSHSATSVLLLKILLTRFLGLDSVRLRYGAINKELSKGSLPFALLAIGDDALRLGSHPFYPHQLDLGELWYKWTGLPFVFGLWVVSKKLWKTKPWLVEQALNKLIKAKLWAQKNDDAVCREAEKHGVLSFEDLKSYYRHLIFDLNEEQLQGLKLFFKILHECGEIKRVPRIEVYSTLKAGQKDLQDLDEDGQSDCCYNRSERCTLCSTPSPGLDLQGIPAPRNNL